MQLKDFITYTLTSIAQGVDEANKYTGQQFQIVRTGKESYVDFDVAVTSTKEKKGKAGIVVWVVGAGGERNRKTQQVSRIKFKVNYRGKKL
ncbi:MAG: trypco2 family protein [Patescibacteria group bacterium]|jgi:hypothetical protein